MTAKERIDTALVKAGLAVTCLGFNDIRLVIEQVVDNAYNDGYLAGIPDIGKKIADRNRMIEGWRGRRLLACRAAGELHDVIAGLASDNGADLPPPDTGLPGGLPAPPSRGHIREMQNTAANLLRTILLWNDGSVSPSILQRF